MTSELRAELTCSICLNVYTDPVTLRCGHSFCQRCVERVLDKQARSKVYNCPQCRAQFEERPLLQKNTTLCNITRHVLADKDQECEIFCMYCTPPPEAASKTCLLCKVSMCDIHLTAHSKSPDHVLIPTKNSFRSRTCSVHKKVLVYYCSEDAECLCVSCCLRDKHWGHQVESLQEASKKKQDKLQIIQEQIMKEMEELENKVKGLQDHVKQIPEKSAAIVERICVQFRELGMKQNHLEKLIVNEISKQREQVSRSLSNLIQHLELKKDHLSKKISTIGERCQMTDPLLYLQTDRDDPDNEMLDSNSNVMETAAINLSEDLIYQTLHSGVMDIMSGLQKGYFVPEASDILWDVTTAANDVRLSSDLKTAFCSQVKRSHPKPSERFESHRVLSTKGFCEGRFYWDVRGSEEGGWSVGMSYRSIGRKGEYSLIGKNKKSWGLCSSNKQYSVRHDRKEIQLACRPSSYKVRIYLDYTAGQLSFHELGNSMRHLYTYNTTFTGALYPVSAVWRNAWVTVLS
ncbi:nuclear factor 7, brain-like [Leptodactylus fuscus]|uniref:nuclear factor 7, brain-like n=1 Tax=Leptodactylus fuscus TaxID=238119 RepID=UPI003F4E5290